MSGAQVARRDAGKRGRSGPGSRAPPAMAGVPPTGQHGQARAGVQAPRAPRDLGRPDIVPDATLESYIAGLDGPRPRVVAGLEAGEVDVSGGGVVHPLGPGAWAHIVEGGLGPSYTVVEPPLDEEARRRLRRLKKRLYANAVHRPKRPGSTLEEEIDRALGLLGGKDQALRYYLVRDIANHGPLEALLQDEHLEDIQGVGDGRVHVIHRDFGMLPTNVRFEDNEAAMEFVRNLSERLGRPVSDAHPIVDATLRDGSRINIVYSRDVSRRGPSFSIRRVHEHPISITQLIKWGTLSAELAAYLWLCLENGMSIFICGESACGKSATLNAVLPFIDPQGKVFTAEDTPEVRPPHPLWQRLLTHETGPEEGRVAMFDLLKAALRSRPDFIVVGEIRGAEGAVAFQAMQTGHPTVATFHAPDRVKMIQRLTSAPIHIPQSFLDNLNVAVFQQAVHEGGRVVRRVVAVDEIQGYSEADGGVAMLPVFVRDAAQDVLEFKGRNNSFVLEERIGRQQGLAEVRDIYKEFDRRASVLQRMVDRGVLGFEEVNAMLVRFHEEGLDAADRVLGGRP